MEHNSLSSANSATQSLINSLTNEPNITATNNNNNSQSLLNHLNQSHLQQNILIGNNHQLQNQLAKDKTFQIIGFDFFFLLFIFIKQKMFNILFL